MNYELIKQCNNLKIADTVIITMELYPFSKKLIKVEVLNNENKF